MPIPWPDTLTYPNKISHLTLQLLYYLVRAQYKSVIWTAPIHPASMVTRSRQRVPRFQAKEQRKRDHV